MNFEIAQPYWQKWWFVLFVILLIGSIVSLFFAFRIKIIHRENNLEQEKAQLEIDLRSSQLSALKVQMNPHFIFNALNSIQDYILTNEKRLANTYLGKFSDLMRLYLEMSNKKNISLEEEIKALELYLELESLRFEDSFEYELKVSPELQTYDMMIPSMILSKVSLTPMEMGMPIISTPIVTMTT
jgi:LytS/YehU family sensor histidine kinase